METPFINFFRHSHPMTLSSGFAFRCYWCKTGGYISNGYHCSECDRWFHKKCGDGKLLIFIHHTSHPEHLLRQKISLGYWDIFWCNKCKRPINDYSSYICLTCKNFSLHESCAREAPPLTIEHPQAHEHPLVFFPVPRNSEHLCEVCKEKVVSTLAYVCFKCNVVIHVECTNLQEINHPCHRKHSLNLLTSGAPDYTDNTCILCGLILEGVLYHCSICNFSVCLGCASIPPPVNVEHLKTHEHKLTLVVRQISFICNACGMQGDRSPYICLQCDFMVHRSCIGLPRVININHHDHRISHIRQLNFGDWVCKVCLQSINRFYGAYSCSVCVNYVVHSQCATRNDVWDGIELEGIPEEMNDITPFKKVDDNLINHCSHKKHYLKLSKDGTTIGGHSRCEACMLPVSSDPVYSCEQCGFFLHEICANLPLKKKHMFHNMPFTLHVGDIDSPKVFSCSACGEFFNGFRYESDHIVLHVGCIFFSEMFSHENHEHPLRYNKTYIGKCDACHRSVKSGAFSCESCDYNLDFYCASLPKTIKHSRDQHLLFLSCKENASGKYWCDICEEEINLNKWFYTCNYCEVDMHVKCVLGDFNHLKPERVFEFREERFVMITNNHSSRPICSGCELRCKTPFIVKAYGSNMFLCSQECVLVGEVILRATKRIMKR